LLQPVVFHLPHDIAISRPRWFSCRGRVDDERLPFDVILAALTGAGALDVRAGLRALHVGACLRALDARAVPFDVVLAALTGAGSLNMRRAGLRALDVGACLRALDARAVPFDVVLAGEFAPDCRPPTHRREGFAGPRSILLHRVAPFSCFGPAIDLRRCGALRRLVAQPWPC